MWIELIVDFILSSFKFMLTNVWAIDANLSISRADSAGRFPLF